MFPYDKIHLTLFVKYSLSKYKNKIFGKKVINIVLSFFLTERFNILYLQILGIGKRGNSFHFGNSSMKNETTLN